MRVAHVSARVAPPAAQGGAAEQVDRQHGVVRGGLRGDVGERPRRERAGGDAVVEALADPRHPRAVERLEVERLDLVEQPGHELAPAELERELGSAQEPIGPPPAAAG